MSTTIVRAGRARLNDGRVDLQVAAHDNNVRPYPGRHFGKYDSDFHTITSRHCTEDHEQLAIYVEGLARDYDGGCVTERGKRYSGVAAYNLWARRIKKGTGVVIRKPRLSKVNCGQVPDDISGLKGRNGPALAKGATIDMATAVALVEAGVKFKALCNPPHGRSPFPVRLGFICDGTLCYYQRRSHRRGYHVPSESTFTLLQGIAGSTSKFGDLIPHVEDPTLATFEQVRVSLRDDVFVILSEEEEPKILQGKAGAHSLEKLGPPRYGGTNPPSLYDQQNAEALLSRLQRHVPEASWRIVSLREHTTMLLTAALTK